jgi:phage terminase large subunit GpA-like protein
MELILTLGLKPMLRTKKQSSKGVINGREINQPEIMYVITFKAYKQDNVSRIKYDRLTDISDGRPTETFRRRVINIEPIESVDVRCIEVDSKSHLFLAGRNFIPTHNTEVGNNIIGYYIHIDPRSIGMWLPTDSLAERHAKKKLWKMIDTTPVLKEVVFPRNKGTGENSTITQLMFTGGAASIYGSNSSASYRSDSISVAIKDDIDGFVDDVEGEGSPIELIDNRTDSFSNRKIYENSTPTIDGMSHIQTEYEESTQEEYYMPCPHCTPKEKALQDKSNMIKFDFDHFVYESNGTTLLSEVKYSCEHCGSLIKEHEKSWMMDYANGAKYIAQKEHKVRGFIVNSFYSPLGWTSWARIIEEYLKANKKLKEGDDRLMKRFINTRLAKVYKPMVKKTDAKELEKLVVGIDEGIVPKDTWKITMAVDVQLDHFWYEVRCLLYGVSYHVLQYGRAETWEDLENIMRETYFDINEKAFQVSACAIDSGYRTDEVYEFCVENEDICIPIKGKTTMEARYTVSTQERETYNIRLYTLNPNNFKDIYDSKIKRAIKLIEKGELSEKNVITFHAQADATLFEQLTSEYRITIKNRGAEKTDWKQYKKDNHLFDCATYNTFLAELLYHRRQKRPTEVVNKKPTNGKVKGQKRPQKKGNYTDNY